MNTKPQKFRLCTLLLFVGLILPGIVQAQTGKITGTVVEAETGEPLPGANVVIEGAMRGAATQPDGRYFILNVAPGSYTLRASIIGYQVVRKQEVIVNANRTTIVDFELEIATYQGDEVTIVAERPDVELDQTATLEVIRPEEIENTPGLTDLGDILDMQAEISDGHFRGGRGGETLYKLGGMSIVSPLSSGSSFSPMVSAIEEVEVITSGFSAKYGNAMSGVVNISMKEGGDAWTSHAELRLRMPGYKHWGGSVYSADPADNPYLSRVNGLEFWQEPDPDNEARRRWQGAIGRGFGSSVDSMIGAQVVYDLWRQAHQDVGLEYGNKVDRLVDFTIGGPLSRHVSMFLGAQYNNDWPVLPSPEANRERQVLGNIVYQAGGGKKLKLVGSFANNYEQVFSSSSGGMYRWVYDRVIGANKVREQALQLGLNWSHVINDRSYYDINLGLLETGMREGVDVLAPDRFREDIYDISVWERVYWPDGYRTGQMDDDFFKEHSTTYSLTGAFVSQVTDNHQVETGVQGSVFSLDIENRLNHSAPTNAVREFYEARPLEGALYVQDKMEFEGMIANLGLRIGGYDPNVRYYVNRFSPFQVSDSTFTSDPDLAETESAPAVIRLQPRLGFSFPISALAVFHLNYGRYLQRPDLEYLVGRRIHRNDELGVVDPRRLGNPLLKPEETTAYDVGIVVGLLGGLTLDASGYYKDVKNLIERVIYMDDGGDIYESLINRQYADIRGVNLRLKKRAGNFSGSVRYNYQIVTGKASTPFDASRIIDESGQRTQLPDPRDIHLDFDRRHNMVATFSASSPNDWGPEIFGFHPLEQLHANIFHESRSGRPFTPFKSNEINSARTPWLHRTDFRVTRGFDFPGGVHAKLYMDIFNLLNHRVYDYGDVFEDAENRQKWATDPESINFYTNDNGFTTNQSIRIYENAPRSINVGIVFEM